MTNYYQVLGVPTNATSNQIKAAYREFAKHFHPDKHTNSDFFKRRFQDVQQAYEVLNNINTRNSYDTERSASNNYNKEINILFQAQIYSLKEELERSQSLLEVESENSTKLKKEISYLKGEITSREDSIRLVNAKASKLESELESNKSALVESLAINYQKQCEYKEKLEKKEKAKSERSKAFKKAEDPLSYLSYCLKHDRLSLLLLIMILGGFMYGFTYYLNWNKENSPIGKAEKYSIRAQDELAHTDIRAFLLNSEEAIKLNPDLKGIRIQRAIVYRGRKEYLLALSEYQALAKIDPTSADAMLGIGDCYLSDESLDSACFYWRKAKQLGSDDANYRLVNGCR